MDLQVAVDHINLVTDEGFTEEEVYQFLNDGISALNIRAEANFPYLQDGDVEYTALPEKYFRMILIPFAAGRIKQNDSSQFEYVDWYGQYESGVQVFLDNYEIPENYKDANGKTKIKQLDFHNSPYAGNGW